MTEQTIKKRSFITLVLVSLTFSGQLRASDFAALADEFFLAARSGQYGDVEAYLSPQWRSAIQPPQFERFLFYLELSDYQRATWGDSQVSDGVGRIEGEFESSSGAFPISLQFLQGDEGWRIHSISVSPAAPPKPLPEPDYEETVALITGVMSTFATAVDNRDMRNFYDSTSTTFRIRHSPKELESTFGRFYGDDDFKSRVQGVPGLAKPVLNEGVLTVRGLYKTAGYETGFKLELVAEQEQWKIISIGVNSDPSNQ